MTINYANVTNNAGSPDEWKGSSLIANLGTSDKNATLTIKDGTFTQNNFIVLKNDDYGVMNIEGGTINCVGGNSGASAVQNWNECNITGGTVNGIITTFVWSTSGKEYCSSVTTVSGDAKINGVFYSNYDTDYVKPTTIFPTVAINGGDINADFEIEYGTLTSTGEINLATGNTVTLAKDTVVSGTIGFGDNKATFKDVKAGNNGITISEGSVVITGDAETEDDGSITVNGDAKISGTLGNNVIVNVKSGAKLTLGDLTAGDGAKIVMENAKSEVCIDGTVTGGTADEPLITTSTESSKQGTVSVGPDAGNIDSSIVDSEITVIPSGGDATEDMTVSGSTLIGVGTPVTLDSTQIVTVSGTWTIVKDANITIEGKLVVPEGCTIIVSAGAVLNFNAASAEIDGTIVIMGAEELTTGPVGAAIVNVDNYSKIEVSGTITVDGVLNIKNNADVEIMTGSSAVVTENGSIVNSNGKLTVGIDALLTINGIVNGEIYNYGTVTYDSDVKATVDSTINMCANGAKVEIVNWVAENGKKITITDAGITLEKGKKSYVATVGNTVTITATTTATNGAVVSGITVTEGAVLEKNKRFDDSEAESASNPQFLVKNVMDVSGNIVISDDETDHNSTLAIDIAGLGGATVSSDLVINEDITVRNAGKLDVTGKIVGTDGTFENGTATVTVKDEGSIVSKNLLTGVVNSAMYKTKVTVGTSTSTIYNYVTIDTALNVAGSDATIKAITVLGDQTLTASNKIPADVTVTVTGKLTIGGEEYEGVKLDVDATGKLTGTGIVDVEGTLYATDKTKVTTATIESDVYSEEVIDGKVVKDGWAKWTNLATALAEAQPGDVITISTEGTVTLESNTTIPSGVTVVVTDATAGFILKDGVTLTIDGTLQTEIDITAETRFAKTAVDILPAESDTYTDSSAIVVNGTLESLVGIKYAEPATGNESPASLSTDGAPISGAYYLNADGYKCVSPLTVAIANIADVASKIEIKGEVTVGDITFDATDDCTEIEVINGAKFTAASVTLVGSTLDIIGTFNGSVVVGDTTVALGNIKTLTVADNEGAMAFVNAGEKADSNISGNASITIVAGTFTAKTSIGGTSVDFIVASGATVVSEGAIVNGDFYIQGTVTVASGKSLAAETGKVMIENGGILSVDAGSSTTAPGSATFKTLYVGMTSEDTTGSVATINGPITMMSDAIAYVAAGSSISDEAQTVLDKMYSTQYNVDGALWMTVYAQSNAVDVDAVEKAPVENAWFAGWENSEGAKATDAAHVGAEDWKIVNAIIEKNVYKVFVYANEGIANVYVDGNLMQKGMIDDGDQIIQGYFLMVSAGEHEITYDLTNGWTGTAAFKVNGDAISGNTFTAEGTPETDTVADTFKTITYEVQISGLEKSGYVPDSPDAPAESGMGITDYLLIILVVLIVVMAI
ncbi:beta strand repeat-containing protein, partial [Candidatus Methanoprimaticola sp. MG2]|uniref:beta strand repeat-containing protein n=1 Tax=Candidatus Methanoprimaticola sp. MG2 TaxID=3228838 RepID=UPI0039C69674